jgi:ABC-type phosphate/phosphonate transport system substrate-binding protein
MGRFPNLRERVELGAFIFIAFLILLPDSSLCSEGLCNEGEITIGFPPYLSITETFRRFQPILDHLESTTRKTIRPVFYKNTASLLRDLEAGSIKMAYLDSITYTMNPSHLKQVAVFIYEGDERIILITRKDSGILRIEDIRNRILARVDNGCGKLWLMSLIRDKPEPLFKEIKEYHGFDSVIFAILFRKSDIGVTTKVTFEALKRRYPGIKEDIRVITISPPYPGYLLVAYKGMDEEVVKLFRNHLIDMSRTIDGNLILISSGIEGFRTSLNTRELSQWRRLMP